MSTAAWIALALGAAAFFFLRGFVQGARQHDLWGELRRWYKQR